MAIPTVIAALAKNTLTGTAVCDAPDLSKLASFSDSTGPSNGVSIVFKKNESERMSGFRAKLRPEVPCNAIMRTWMQAQAERVAPMAKCRFDRATNPYTRNTGLSMQVGTPVRPQAIAQG